MKTTNDVCVHTWGNKKNGRAGTNISQVSQPPAGPRIRAAQRPKILVNQMSAEKDFVKDDQTCKTIVLDYKNAIA